MNTVTANINWVSLAQSMFDDLKVDTIEKTPIFYDHDDDILAYVVAWMKQGKETFECHSLISQHSRLVDDEAYKVVLTPEIREEATKIRRHFQNTIMLRSLKDEHVSKWMTSTSELLESPNRIKEDHVRIIVTLPRFYRESKETENIFKGMISLDPTVPYNNEINEVFEYIGCVRRDSRNEKELRYYFKNSKNEVLAMFLPNHSPAVSLWKYVLAKSNKIKIKSFISMSRQPGHDFYFYKLGNFYELSDADS